MKRTIIKLLNDQPFFGYMLVYMPRRWSKETTSACITFDKLEIELLVNKEYFKAQTPDQQMGTLLHEMYHVAFMHPMKFRSLGVQVAGTHEIFNIAADMAVNSFLTEIQLLPTDPIPEWCDFPRHKSLEYYYEQLLGNQKAMEKLKEKCGALMPKHEWPDRVPA